MKSLTKKKSGRESDECEHYCQSYDKLNEDDFVATTLPPILTSTIIPHITFDKTFMGSMSKTLLEIAKAIG
jgi:hypothetical protein